MQINLKKIRERFMRMPIIMHIISAFLALFILGFIILKVLNIYTHHNMAIVVPDVKGLQIEEAEPFFENNELRYTVIDSVYSKDVTPGAIVEMVPSAGSKVKEGRIIFITLNAKTAEMATIPDVADLSFRQAYALLQSRGFTSIDIKYVGGSYRDLALGIELRGKELKAGEKIPLAAKLVLKVSDGGEEPDIDADSLGTFSTPSENLSAPDTKPKNTEPTQVKSNDENWF